MSACQHYGGGHVDLPAHQENCVMRDDYPLRAATYTACHAKVAPEHPHQVTCEVCGDVTDHAGCPMSRTVLP